MGGVLMNTRVTMIRDKIKMMREKVAEAYLENKYDYNEVLKLSTKLDRLILLEIKARSSQKAG